MLRKACLGIMSPVGRRGGQAPGQPHLAPNSPLLTQIYQMLKGTGPHGYWWVPHSAPPPGGALALPAVAAWAGRQRPSW